MPTYSVGNGAFRRERVTLESVPLEAALAAGTDCVVIVSAHSCYDWSSIVAKAPLVVYTCNATQGVVVGSEKIVLLGAVAPG